MWQWVAQLQGMISQTNYILQAWAQRANAALSEECLFWTLAIEIALHYKAFNSQLVQINVAEFAQCHEKVGQDYTKHFMINFRGVSLVGSKLIMPTSQKVINCHQKMGSEYVRLDTQIMSSSSPHLVGCISWSGDRSSMNVMAASRVVR